MSVIVAHSRSIIFSITEFLNNGQSIGLIVLSIQVLSEQVNVESDRIYHMNNSHVNTVPSRGIVIQPPSGEAYPSPSNVLASCVSSTLIFCFTERDRERGGPMNEEKFDLLFLVFIQIHPVVVRTGRIMQTRETSEIIAERKREERNQSTEISSISRGG